MKHLENHPNPPGEHGRGRRRTESDDALRLREQRLRAQHGLREAQLRRAVDEVKRHPERTGDVLVQLLESRLDAVVPRAGLARTTRRARRTVTHQHVLVDGERVDRPSYRVRLGQLVEVAPRSRQLPPFRVTAAGGHAEVLPAVPPHLRVDLAELRVAVLRPSTREEVPVTCDVAKVVEYYSR